MGKGGDDNKAVDTSSANEVLIDGQIYDITNFAKKHPGGSVIKFYAGNGIDATQAFNNFHIRSKKVKKYLDSIPHRPADPAVVAKNMLPGQSALLEDFNKLTNDLEAEGFFKPNMGHVIYRVFEIVAMHAAGFYLLFHGHVALGIAILGVVSGRCGWLMHEGGHYSLTGESDSFISISKQGSYFTVHHLFLHILPTRVLGPAGNIFLDRSLQVKKISAHSQCNRNPLHSKHTRETIIPHEHLTT